MPFGDGTGPDGKGPRGYWCPYYFNRPPVIPSDVPVLPRLGLGRRRGYRGGR